MANMKIAAAAMDWMREWDADIAADNAAAGVVTDWADLPKARAAARAAIAESNPADYDTAITVGRTAALIAVNALIAERERRADRERIEREIKDPTARVQAMAAAKAWRSHRAALRANDQQTLYAN